MNGIDLKNNELCGLCNILEMTPLLATMGYYTKFEFSAKLRGDTPPEVIGLLQKIISDGHKLADIDNLPEWALELPFFQTPDWDMVFFGKNCENYPDPILITKEGKYWILKIWSELKGYDDEIEEFIKWITPYIKNRKLKHYVGFTHGEEGSRSNIYITRQ